MPEMTTLTCPTCNQQFERKSSSVRNDLRRGRTKFFCSARCANLGQSKERIQFVCPVCHKEFERRSCDVGETKTGEHFCSKSCAASFVNSPRCSGLHPKRSPIGEQICVICGEKFTHRSRTKCCPSCVDAKLHYGLMVITRRKRGYQTETKYSPLSENSDPSDIQIYTDYPISDLMGPPGPNRYRLIRAHALKVTRDRPQICAMTDYDLHVNTCHIRGISDFSPHTPLGVVNDPRNLVLLSPNKHWELDHGELDIDELPEAKAFREFEKDAVRGEYLPS
jgi:YHS domain-containing protein